MASTTPTQRPASPDDVESIFNLLRRGLGHEWVDDRNVDRLIGIAMRDGHQLLEQELREWRSSCGGSARRPDAGSEGQGAARH